MIEDTKENRLAILKQLGDECYKNRDYVKAIIYFTRYTEIDQSNAFIYNIIGYLYQRLSKYENLDLQISNFEKAVELAPEYTQAYRNLALTYPLIGEYDKAIKCFLKIFELDAITDDYMAYACLQIRLKNFAEGWKYYEARFLKEHLPTPYPEINKPRWEGQKIEDNILLIQHEQGLGDTIQFFRYAELAKPLVKKIILRVQKEVFELVKFNTEDIEVVTESTPLEDLIFDYHIPLLSLLNVLNADINNIPKTEGYIKAHPDKAAEYKNKYFDNDYLKIGISWNGIKGGNNFRDIPLECFYPLAQLENVKIYSFQKGHGAEQLKKIPDGIEIIDLGKTFGSFSDTAAAMSNLDLFVTSDNSVLNLAGGMGVKTFALLNKHAEWRWFLDEGKTPWYDSIEILKQDYDLQDWAVTVNKVIEIIKNNYDKLKTGQNFHTQKILTG